MTLDWFFLSLFFIWFTLFDLVLPFFIDKNVRWRKIGCDQKFYSMIDYIIFVIECNTINGFEKLLLLYYYYWCFILIFPIDITLNKLLLFLLVSFVLNHELSNFSDIMKIWIYECELIKYTNIYAPYNSQIFLVIFEDNKQI